jgi:hypothetical protein
VTSFTRRQFLQAGAATLVAGGGSRGADLPLLVSSGESMALPPLFTAPQLIRYDADCFTIHDRDIFLYGSSFHYPRCPESLWRDRLTKLQRAGFNTIETYIFWNYHEPVEGRLDLSEVERFVELVSSMGFWIILRVGPYACAEWDAGGFPHWVIAKQFPLRSNSPQSLATSAHWFDEVLPAVARYQITRGGRVILMQIENEYNYWAYSDQGKLAYVTALAEMAWKNGIDIPLITCWTEQARLKQDAAMTRIADFCNFYPRWEIVKQVIPGLEQLRMQQPSAPLGITEMQGGWFGQFGGVLPEKQKGVGPAQFNMLAKTAIEQGATFLNTYMGFGGTNFDWAGKKIITSYDYAAPLAEPGGLREKYYAARGVGQSLYLLGPALLRAEAVKDGVDSSNPAVSATLRAVSHNGAMSGALLVRENAGADQTFHLHMADPRNPSQKIAIPQRGILSLGARAMKMCPVGLPIADGELIYSTAEILAHGRSSQHWLILYDDPDRPVEFCLASDRSPQIVGQTLYHSWNGQTREVVIGVKIGNAPSTLRINGTLQVILLPREQALRTWISPSSSNPPASIPWMSDAALLSDSGDSANGVWTELAFAPGKHEIAALLPRRSSRCRIDGAPANLSYDPQSQMTHVELSVAQPPAPPVEIQNVETWVDRFDPRVGEWASFALGSIEKSGPIPYGYVKYRLEFVPKDALGLSVAAFCDDTYQAFVNGEHLAPQSVADQQAEFSLANIAKPGTNLLEISYELFGSPNFGPDIGELKGLKSASLVSAAGNEPIGGSWQLQRFPAPMRGRGIDPDFSVGGWNKVSLSNSNDPGPFIPAFTWCRALFTLDDAPANWQIPRQVTIHAHRDALLYLNGKFVGRYATAGPQTEFYLPEPYLRFGAAQPNVLTVLLAYTDNARAIRTLRIAPYEEFALSRAKIEFDW